MENHLDWMVVALAFTVLTALLVAYSRFNRWLRPTCWHCHVRAPLDLQRTDPRNWQCAYCGDQNVLDSNWEPIDYVPQEKLFKVTLSAEQARRRRNAATLKRAQSPLIDPNHERNFITDGRRLCDKCAESQERKLSLLRTFDPPNMDDKLFEFAADDYATKLEKQFKLCDRCETTVHRAIYASQRLVMTSTLGSILWNSKSVLGNEDEKKISALRLFWWHLMTSVRRCVHCATYLLYLISAYYSALSINSAIWDLEIYKEALECVIESSSMPTCVGAYQSAYFALVLATTLPALFSPLRSGRRKDFKIQFAYLTCRILLIGWRLSAFRWQLKNEFYHSVILFAVDTLIVLCSRVFLSRRSDTLATRVLRQVGQRIVAPLRDTVADSRYLSTTQAQRCLEEEAQKDTQLKQSPSRLFGMSLDGDDDESVSPRSTHPFHVETFKRSQTTQSTLGSTTPMRASFNMSPLMANQVIGRGFRDLVKKPEPAMRERTLDLPLPWTGRANGKQNVVFNDPKFVIDHDPTGLENLFENVSLVDPNVQYAEWIKTDRTRTFLHPVISLIFLGFVAMKKYFDIYASLLPVLITLIIVRVWDLLVEPKLKRHTGLSRCVRSTVLSLSSFVFHIAIIFRCSLLEDYWPVDCALAIANLVLPSPWSTVSNFKSR